MKANTNLNEEAEEEIISPHVAALQKKCHAAGQDALMDELLRLSQSASTGPVQIPADLLASLFTIMTGLTTQVLTLETDVVRLTSQKVASQTSLSRTKQELEATKDLLGVTGLVAFPLFPKLALELRLMVVSSQILIFFASSSRTYF